MGWRWKLMAMTGGTAKLVSQGTPPGWPGPVSLYVYYKVESQNIENNQTVLSLGMYVTTPKKWDIGGWTDYNGSYVGTATSGENCKTFDGDIPNFYGTRWLVENQQVTVTHNDDGTKTAIIYWHWGVNSGWPGVMANPSGSFSLPLETIPRASSITSAADAMLGGKCIVKWTPFSTSFRFRLRFSLGDWSFTTGAIHPNTTYAYTYTGYTIPLETASQIPDDTTATMTVTLYTYSDSGGTAQIGGENSATFAVTVPNNAATQPSVSMGLAPVSSLGAAFSGLYIQGKTKVKATLSASGKYGASIRSYSMRVEGVTLGSDDGYTSGYLSQYGSIPVYGYAEDSRGFTGSAAQNISVIAYSKPMIEVSVCGRCDSGGNLVDTGTYLRIKAKRTYSPVRSGNTQKNFCQIRFRYKAESAASYSAWTTILAGSSLDSDEIATGALLGGVLSAQSTYLVQVQAIDDVGEAATTTISISTSSVYMHRTKNAMGLGKYVEGENLLDVAWDAHFRGEVRIGDTGMSLKEYIKAVISEGG